MDLRHEDGTEFRFTSIGWAFYTNLALRYGWRMPGTEAPKEWPASEGPWQGAYDWSVGQRVTDRDALEFSEALRRYLADPARSTRANELANDFKEQAGVSVTVDENDHGFVQSFVVFAENGGFEVW